MENPPWYKFCKYKTEPWGAFRQYAVYPYIFVSKRGSAVHNQYESRRDILKKGAAFVLPTITTFSLSALKVQASTGSFSARGVSAGGNGNHYGNTKGDYNLGDNSSFNGGNNPKSHNNRP
jgi:hypothetical protein